MFLVKIANNKKRSLNFTSANRNEISKEKNIFSNQLQLE